MEEEKNPIQVADRLFQTMEVLAARGATGLVELSRILNLHKSTVHRLLNSLIYMGYAVQEEDTGKYRLTYKIMELSSKMMENIDVLDLVHPIMQRLMEQAGETVHFVQLDGTDVVYIDKVESRMNSIRLVSRIGSRVPVFCSGVGKAIAAEMEEEQIRRLWDASEIRKWTEHTITEYPAFLEECRRIHSQGYALDNEENELGVRCIAAAIPGKVGSARFAYSISGPVGRMTDERIEELKEYILEAKAALCRELF
ncbi:MAG: IclR family transcriptional regulator [Candidatus Limivivens sp.]|nr:IclR family transcriptional regulator [Candidatus Limivivens sp.]